jgi:hypothetical protein
MQTQPEAPSRPGQHLLNDASEDTAKEPSRRTEPRDAPWAVVLCLLLSVLGLGLLLISRWSMA